MVENELKRCVASIEMQTYRNLEIILIDDGSEDNCPKICDVLAKEDSRIKIFHKENGGQSSARNLGLENATGEYISFVDSDDYIDKYFIQDLYDSLCNSDAEIAIAGFTVVDENMNFIKEEKVDLNKDCCDGREILSKIMDKDGYKFVTLWNRMYRRSIFDSVRFEEGRIFEDEAICHKLFYGCKKINLISNCSYHYVIRNGSTMNSVMTAEKLFMKQMFHQERLLFYKSKHDDKLFIKERQLYCNCLVNIFMDYSYCLNREDRIKFQHEMRKYAIDAARKTNSILLKTENILGYCNLTMTAWIKRAYKRVENDKNRIYSF